MSHDEARRPAGAPEEERQPAGAPPLDDAAAIDAEVEAADEVERDFDALLDDVRRERDEYLEIAQRARADFENYRRRTAREASEAERRGKAGLARELFGALDNLERALRAAGIDPDAAATGPAAAEAPSEEVSAHEALARGVALVYGELRAALERAGVQTYVPTGEPFDPATCEALTTRPAADGAGAGVVVETVERGYLLDGQVLRPARVIVSA